MPFSHYFLPLLVHPISFSGYLFGPGLISDCVPLFPPRSSIARLALPYSLIGCPLSHRLGRLLPVVHSRMRAGLCCCCSPIVHRDFSDFFFSTASLAFCVTHFAVRRFWLRCCFLSLTLSRSAAFHSLPGPVALLSLTRRHVCSGVPVLLGTGSVFVALPSLSCNLTRMRLCCRLLPSPCSYSRTPFCPAASRSRPPPPAAHPQLPPNHPRQSPLLSFKKIFLLQGMCVLQHNNNNGGIGAM